MGHKVYMTKGDGQHSYAKNSIAQRRIADALVLPILNETLKQVSLPPSGKPIVVADLGCCHGSNSITNVSYVVETLRSRSSESNETTSKTSREFQVYFSDLAWNDFNALFHLLCDNEADRSKYFVAGVPGCFFDRLFPRSSVHIFISILSLHFLSKAPDSVKDENSPAFNKGNLWLHGSTDATAQAYKEQFSLGLKSFLQARYEELVPGGLLFFIVKTRPVEKANVLRSTADAVDTMQICIRETAEELLSKGIVTKQQLDTLNVPLYYAIFQDEVLEIVKSFNSNFEILIAEEMGFPLFLPHGPSRNETFDRVPLVRVVTGFARGILGGIFEQVMGEEEHEVFWQHFAQNAKKHEPDFKHDCHFGCVSIVKK